MSKSKYVTGLRAVEQLLATPDTEVRRIFAEYQTANPRVTALITEANNRGIEVQPANRARLQQISGEVRHQGIVAEVRRSTVLDEAGLRSLVEERLQEGGDRLLLLLLDGVQDPHNLGACMRTADAAGVDAIIVPRHGAAGLGGGGRSRAYCLCAGGQPGQGHGLAGRIRRDHHWYERQG